jgi:hypothetical protein
MKRYTCGNGEGMFETKNGHWIEYSEHEKIVNDLKKQLELTAVGCQRVQLYAVLDKLDRITGRNTPPSLKSLIVNDVLSI